MRQREWSWGNWDGTRARVAPFKTDGNFADSSTAAEEIVEIRNAGYNIKAVNFSYENPIPDDDLHDMTITLSNAGIILVSSATGNNGAYPQYPGGYDEAFSVTGLYLSDSPLFGQSYDYSGKQDIFANSQAIAAAANQEDSGHQGPPWNMPPWYRVDGGVSFGIPAACAMIALIYSSPLYPGITAEGVKDLIRENGRQLTTCATNDPTFKSLDAAFLCPQNVAFNDTENNPTSSTHVSLPDHGLLICNSDGDGLDPENPYFLTPVVSQLVHQPGAGYIWSDITLASPSQHPLRSIEGLDKTSEGEVSILARTFPYYDDNDECYRTDCYKFVYSYSAEGIVDTEFLFCTYEGEIPGALETHIYDFEDLSDYEYFIIQNNITIPIARLLCRWDSSGSFCYFDPPEGDVKGIASMPGASNKLLVYSVEGTGPGAVRHVLSLDYNGQECPPPLPIEYYYMELWEDTAGSSIFDINESGSYAGFAVLDGASLHCEVHTYDSGFIPVAGGNGSYSINPTGFEYPPEKLWYTVNSDGKPYLVTYCKGELAQDLVLVEGIRCGWYDSSAYKETILGKARGKAGDPHAEYYGVSVDSLDRLHVLWPAYTLELPFRVDHSLKSVSVGSETPY